MVALVMERKGGGRKMGRYWAFKAFAFKEGVVAMLESVTRLSIVVEVEG
jgi:hypothetical protein